MRSVHDFIEESKRINRVSVEEANEQTIKITNLNDVDYDWEISSRLQVYEILDTFMQLKQNGNSSDFHNYAVTFARINDYDAACDIIRSGLKRFPYNIDLLADFLEYAPMSSDENCYQECESYFQTIKNIDLCSWTWRGFNFTIDYLLSKIDQNINEKATIKKDLDVISKKYIELFPMDERAYYSLYLIEQKFGSINNKVCLMNAVEHPIRAAHCALRLAEIFFDEKDYSQSLTYLNRAINDSIDRNGSLKLVNIYLLRFIIKVSVFMNRQELVDNTLSNTKDDDLEKEIRDIYCDYRIAKSLGIEPSKKDSFNQYVKLLELASGIIFDDAEDFE